MKHAVWILLVIMLAATAQAAEIHLKESETGTKIKNQLISINTETGDIIKQINEDGTLELEITKGQTIELTVDNQETQGKDYYRKIKYSGEQEIILFPVGTIRGIIKDSLDNIVGFADLKFACKPLPKINHPSNADKFGTFTTVAPVGKCKVYASYGNAIGFKEIQIEQGELKDIEIQLDKTITTIPTKKYAGIGFILLIAIAALGIILYLKTKKTTKPKQEPKKTNRSEDITKTLSKKEKEIVQYLELNKGKALQAQIRHNTGIPRTTLARIIQSLEDKNILKVRKEGKAVKIKLTDWFLGKE
ncbi:hypothetical protein KY338_02425 [Candidatus Woesearchaeota archaeon]|nr:hypothetical protein [Candidatus Woesearchaeota archaeon]MBW3005928.1 hypothetical protein [Candidatus Woesearchaeota archaeon]